MNYEYIHTFLPFMRLSIFKIPYKNSWTILQIGKSHIESTIYYCYDKWGTKFVIIFIKTPN